MSTGTKNIIGPATTSDAQKVALRTPGVTTSSKLKKVLKKEGPTIDSRTFAVTNSLKLHYSHLRS